VVKERPPAVAVLGVFGLLPVDGVVSDRPPEVAVFGLVPVDGVVTERPPAVAVFGLLPVD
jgi:hypothetical protein